MAERSINPSFMNGVPDLLVLRLLSDREMYGYELVQAIRAVTREAIVLAEGVVYPALHALEAGGLLKSKRKPVNGRTRVYYQTTAAGRRRLEAMTADWSRITNAVAGVIKGEAHVAA
ncbi:MAG: PadR family transcriptional regulator [Alphaproteobacteria bacterium]|nr:PadR family transcriptional regulator [Alphaproteobacteria bacterium]